MPFDASSCALVSRAAGIALEMIVVDQPWHVLSDDDVARTLGTDRERGLSSAEAAARAAAAVARQGKA